MKKGLQLAGFLVVLFACLPARTFVSAESEDGESNIDINGALRLNGGYYRSWQDLAPSQDSGMGGSVLRFIVTGTLLENLDFEMNTYANSTSLLPDLGGAFNTAGGVFSSYRTQALSTRFQDKGSVSGGWGWDRVFLRYNWNKANLTVGRFPLNYSVASMFAVNDFFAPFSASSVNTVYKPGVDGVRLAIQTGMLSAIEIVGLVGHPDPLAYDPDEDEPSPTWGDSALLAYMRTVLWNVDFALMGGKLAGKWVVGGSVQGEAGPFSLYTEGHVAFPDANGDFKLEDENGPAGVHTKLTAGFNTMFSWHNVILGAEYAFFSNGGKPSQYYDNIFYYIKYPDSLPYAGQHYGAFHAGMEINPLLFINTMVLMNIRDLSGLASLSLAYNFGNDAEAVLGAFFPWGKQAVDNGGFFYDLKSEFGMSPITVFCEMRYYF